MARIAVITGAASGIGQALASALVAGGATVVVAGIDGDGAGRAAGELARHGPGAATPAGVDVRDAGAVQALVDHTREKHGRLGVMVNNAGIGAGWVGPGGRYWLPQPPERPGRDGYSHDHNTCRRSRAGYRR